MQKSAISEGAILLVDEIEHGLEPHRIIGAIAQLKADQVKATNEHKPIGQVLMTTHSDVALGEAGTKGLFVAQTSRPPVTRRCVRRGCRSEERRVGKECVSTGRCGGWPYH